MTLETFLAFLLTSAGAGAAVFAAIEGLDKLFNLSSDLKFWLSIILAAIFPPLAYLGLVALGVQPFSPDGLFGALAVSWMVSQAIHRQTDPANKDPKPAAPVWPVARPPTPDSLKVMGPRSEPNSDEG